MYAFRKHFFYVQLGAQRACSPQSGLGGGVVQKTGPDGGMGAMGVQRGGARVLSMGSLEGGSKEGFLEQEALVGFSQGRQMSAPSFGSIPLYVFTYSIRLILEWFLASSSTCPGPPTSIVPRARTTQKPLSITKT